MNVKTKYLTGLLEDLNHLDLKEGMNNITGKDLMTILSKSYLSDIMSEELSYSLSVDLVIRSITSNEVYMIEEDSELSINISIKEHPSQSLEYWLLLANIQDKLRADFDLDEDLMKKTILQPIGLIKSGNSISLLFHLIVKDEDINMLNKGFKYSVLKLEEVNTFTTLSNRSKIILPTLKIVRSGSIEERDTDNK